MAKVIDIAPYQRLRDYENGRLEEGEKIRGFVDSELIELTDALRDRLTRLMVVRPAGGREEAMEIVAKIIHVQSWMKWAVSLYFDEGDARFLELGKEGEAFQVLLSTVNEDQVLDILEDEELDLSELMLLALAKQNNAFIRGAVAAHKDVSESVLDLLIFDEDPMVRLRAMSRSKADKDKIMEAIEIFGYEFVDREMKDLALEDGNLENLVKRRLQVFKKIVEKENVDVKILFDEAADVLKNPGFFPVEILEQAYGVLCGLCNRVNLSKEMKVEIFDLICEIESKGLSAFGLNIDFENLYLLFLRFEDMREEVLPHLVNKRVYPKLALMLLHSNGEVEGGAERRSMTLWGRVKSFFGRKT